MRYIVNLILVILAAVITLWFTRAMMSRNLPPLEQWHRPILDSEFRASKYPGGISFADYQDLESALMKEVRERVVERLTEPQKVRPNRYFIDSPAHPDAWPSNWNLSFELMPPEPRGAIVLIHGASDSPYSVRALAELFHRAGLYVIAPRLPGHGTIPGELTVVQLADWTAILPMVRKQVSAMVAPDKPVYIAGYSTGATLAIKHALDAIENSTIEQVDGLFLVSPAIGVTVVARFARWDSLVSKIPGLEQFAWGSVIPEYDPFKYASFPKQAGHLVYELAEQNRQRIEKLKLTENWREFPPVITFQSVVDETVSAAAVLDLHSILPDNDNQLILFDVNRSDSYVPFLFNDGAEIVNFATTEGWSSIDATLVTNDEMDSKNVVAKRRCPRRDNCTARYVLDKPWPPEVFSLSHVAVPFPPDDPLYGIAPATNAPGGYQVGKVRAKGERHVLTIPAEELNRLRYNPFFSYMQQRIIDFCAACTRPLDVNP